MILQSFKRFIQRLWTRANESSVVIPLNYRNEYAVFNSEVIESYTFNSIPNHVDVAAIQLKIKGDTK